jgi:uncharacterized protein YdaU (DUF1376 family)
MHYYQHHIGDFIKDTTHLDDHQLATYLRMLWAYYTSESPISSDFEDVAFAMRTDEKTVRLLLRHFFTESPDGWHHTRCDKEIADYHAKAEKAQKAANARWSNAKAMRTHTERNADEPVFDANQEPITNNQEPIKRQRATIVAPPVGVSDSVWQDFVRHRKAKKAQVTQTVIDGIQREADKAGWTMDAALRECITRNWQSFKADWVADKNLSQTGQMNQRVASGLTRGLIGGGNDVKLLGN